MLSASKFTQQIRLATPPTKGYDWIKLSSAIGKGIYTWIIIPINVNLQGVTTGNAGAGAITSGRLKVAPSHLPVTASFLANGLKGKDSLAIAKGIGKGVAKTINRGGKYYGASIGVGNGADVSKVVYANSKTLQGILVTSMALHGIVGTDALRLAKAISIGVSGVVMTGFGFASVKGTPAPAPATGTSKCFVK